MEESAVPKRVKHASTKEDAAGRATSAAPSAHSASVPSPTTGGNTSSNSQGEMNGSNMSFSSSSAADLVAGSGKLRRSGEIMLKQLDPDVRVHRGHPGTPPNNNSTVGGIETAGEHTQMNTMAASVVAYRSGTVTGSSDQELTFANSHAIATSNTPSSNNIDHQVAVSSFCPEPRYGASLTVWRDIHSGCECVFLFGGADSRRMVFFGDLWRFDYGGAKPGGTVDSSSVVDSVIGLASVEHMDRPGINAHSNNTDAGRQSRTGHNRRDFEGREVREKRSRSTNETGSVWTKLYGDEETNNVSPQVMQVRRVVPARGRHTVGLGSAAATTPASGGSMVGTETIPVAAAVAQTLTPNTSATIASGRVRAGLTINTATAPRSPGSASVSAPTSPTGAAASANMQHTQQQQQQHQHQQQLLSLSPPLTPIAGAAPSLFERLSASGSTDAREGVWGPSGRHFHSCVVYGDALWIFGGKSNKYENELWRYDLRLDSWERVQTHGKPPTPRYGHTAVVHAGAMWICGGYDSYGDVCDDMFMFDFRARIWIAISTQTVSHNSTSPRGPRLFHHSAVVHNGSMYVTNGKGVKAPGKMQLWEFRFSMHTWSLVVTRNSGNTKLAPNIRWGHQAVVCGDRMYVVGGADTAIAYGDVWTFDFGELEWHSRRVLVECDDEPAESGSAAAAGASLSPGREVLTKSTGASLASSRTVALASTNDDEGMSEMGGRLYISAALAGGRLILFGGMNAQNFLFNDVWVSCAGAPDDFIDIERTHQHGGAGKHFVFSARACLAAGFRGPSGASFVADMRKLLNDGTAENTDVRFDFAHPKRDLHGSHSSMELTNDICDDENDDEAARSTSDDNLDDGPNVIRNLDATRSPAPGPDSLFAHRCILMARSTYFRVMFDAGSNHREALTGVVRITECSRTVFGAFLDFLYTGTDDALQRLDVSELCESVRIADMYQVLPFRRSASIRLSEFISTDNAVTLYSFAELVNARSLQRKCLSYLLHNYTKMVVEQEGEPVPDELVQTLNVFVKL